MNYIGLLLLEPDDQVCFLMGKGTGEKAAVDMAVNKGRHGFVNSLGEYTLPTSETVELFFMEVREISGDKEVKKVPLKGLLESVKANKVQNIVLAMAVFSAAKQRGWDV